MKVVIRVLRGDRGRVTELIEGQPTRDGGVSVGAGDPIGGLPAGYRGEVVDLGMAVRSWDLDLPGWLMTFVVDKGPDVAVGLFSMWVYDHLKGCRVEIGGEPVDVADREEVERLVAKAFLASHHY